MQALQKSPRFKFDKPVYDFEALKPRILRAALAALQNSDETFWKGRCFVTFQGWIQFEIAFPRGFKIPKERDPKEVLCHLDTRAGERAYTHPDIVLIKERLAKCLAESDFVNFYDYLDDYEAILNELPEERNRYFHGLLVKTINSFKHVEYPEPSYVKATDYNSPLTIRKVRLAKRLDAVWTTYETIKPYIGQARASLIDEKLRHINNLIVDAPTIDSIDDSIDKVSALIKGSLEASTINWLYDEAVSAARDKMKLIHERNRLIFSGSDSEQEVNFKLALLYKKTIDNAERQKEAPYPILTFKFDFMHRVDRLNRILSFLSLHMKKYPASIKGSLGSDAVFSLEQNLIHDPEVVSLFQKLISIFAFKKDKHPQAASAYQSLYINLKNENVLNAYKNTLTLYERLACLK